VQDDELMSSSAAAGASAGGLSQLAGSVFPTRRPGDCWGRTCLGTSLFHYIHVQLVKTNQMIYDMLYKICSYYKVVRCARCQR